MEITLLFRVFMEVTNILYNSLHEIAARIEIVKSHLTQKEYEDCLHELHRLQGYVEDCSDTLLIIKHLT